MIDRCDGRQLLAALEASAAWLEGHRASVDALNVFPVPDGDTGTNMSMTLDAALREAREVSAHDVAVETIAERAAHGALMGARGNSGVILSQLLRGFASALRGARHVGPTELAAALGAAAEAASRAVMQPVEGTILTVSAAAATAAAREAGRGGDVMAVLDATLEEARAAVARTPQQLAILEQAGVVDAGAQGYALIVEGALRHLRGQPTRIAADADAQDAQDAQDAHPSKVMAKAHVAHGDDYGYCTEFVLAGSHLDLPHIRETVAAMGTSTLVVGEDDVVRVHVHTEDPGRVLSYAAPLGQLHRIKIDNMQDQHDRFVAQADGEAAPASTPSAPAYEALPPQGAPIAGLVGVVAVAPSDNLAEVFRSLGSGAIVRGGQTMNPSTSELLAAVDALPQDDVILLPNNGNVLLAAEQARTLTNRRVAVVPARSVPQGMAALVAYSPDADLATNARAMSAAMEGVRTGEVTTAVRDARIDGLSVRAGDALGLLDDRAVLSGPGRDAVTLDLMARMGAHDGEILTVYYGANVSAADAQALAEEARRCFDGLEVEVVDGGQPHYPYIMSLE